MQKALKIMGAIAASLLFFLLGLSAYGLLYAEPKAAQAAQKFCQNVKPGDNPAEIIRQAKEADASPVGLSWRKSADDLHSLSVNFVGMPPFSRHICTVTADSKVIKAEYSHLD